MVRSPVEDMHRHGHISIVEAEGMALLEGCQSVEDHAVASLLRLPYRLKHLPYQQKS